ncbi:MAG: GWxTD domain-containing protein [Gemmatimonadales bacterium]|nr:GWxTD domain-containing protein [Gemmatimonadales bacterium]
MVPRLPSSPEARTRRFVERLIVGLPLAALAACGSWQRVGTPEPATAPPERLPAVFDPSTVYRQMGLMVDAGPIPFIGTVKVLAGPPPDSLMAVVALSLHNRGLSFRRDGDAFLAEYRVELVFRQGTAIARQVTRDERIRVSTFRETQRSDESVIFQQFVPLVAGQYGLTVTVRDRNGPNSSHFEQLLSVTQLSTPAVTSPIAIYEGRPRTAISASPDLVANPRSTAEYGTDSLRFYLESYRLPAGTAIVLSALDAGGRVAWLDSAWIDAAIPLIGLVFTVPPARLSIGRYDLRVALGGNVLSTTPFLVSFSDRWVLSNLEDVISLLRYFTSPDTLRSLAEAPPEERGAAWQRFWRASDPNPATPENEALDQYFARVQSANEQFREEGLPGWLTDRGEVFISLGEPDDVVDRRSELQGRSRVVYWVYNEYRLTLSFIDDTGFGRYRLDPRSRSEYLRVLNRVRRAT